MAASITSEKKKKKKGMMGSVRKMFSSKKSTKSTARETPSTPPKPVAIHTTKSPGNLSALTHGSAARARNGGAAPSGYPDTITTRNAKAQQDIGKGSWMTRSKWFQDMSDQAFDVVDQDGSGHVDEKELYSGLLLIHLKLGCYAGPAACKPVDRERLSKIFQKMDADGSGALDREEFREVMEVLCSNVFTRVMAQWALTLLIVPLVAKYMLDGIGFVIGFVWNKIHQLDQYDELESMVLEKVQIGQDWLVQKSPDIIVEYAAKAKDIIDSVPAENLATIPVTLLSCILGCLVVPYTIFKIDEFFQSMADKKQKKQKVKQS